MSRYRPLFWVIPALTIGVCSGALTARIGLEKRVNDLVAAAYERESQEYKALTVNITQDTEHYDVPSFFSDREDFTAAPHDGKYEDKIGFSYTVDNTVPKPYYDRASDKVIDLRYGEVYKWSIDKWVEETQQHLALQYFDGNSVFYSSRVDVIDMNFDNVPDRITLEEYREGAGPKITIHRKRNGELEYESVDEQGAKQIFDFYTALFQQFKKDENIDARVEAYVPLMKVGL